MNPAWQKRLLLVAAARNVIGGISALLDPSAHFARMFHGALALDDPLQRFFFICVWINVIAWGVGYAVAAFLPASRAAILAAGGVGKLAYFAASAAAFHAGAGNASLLAAGLVDVAFAIGFAVILVGEARRDRRPWPRRAPAVSSS